MKKHFVSIIAICTFLFDLNNSSASSVSCTVNLELGSHNCGSIPEIKILALSSATSGTGTGKALLKVSLDSVANPSLYSEARFRVVYLPQPKTGWTVNIGDSSTNDGYKGDAGTQSNDAEMQIVNSTLSVYGNDDTPAGISIPSVSLMQEGLNDEITLRVSNYFLEWKQKITNRFGYQTYLEGRVSSQYSQYLYALDSQNDREGLRNNDIYASFNRTISYRSDRLGRGIGSVQIELLPPQSGIGYPPPCGTTTPCPPDLDPR